MNTSRPAAPLDVLLCVTGSIAAYKAVELTRLLVKAHQSVEVLLTRSAGRFVGAETFAALTGNRPWTDMFGGQGNEPHIALAARARSLLIAPATADVLARLASGRADELLSATALSYRGPIFVAPAMHPAMWAHPATQANVQLLRDRGVTFLGPVEGEVASGEHGVGRMMEPAQIAAALTSREGDLAGRRVVVSAGPTVEDIDPVRYIGNRSTGKMGFALARRAAERGADVELVAGPSVLPTPHQVRRSDVRSALEMLTTLQEQLKRGADALIMSAAVGDFRPAQPLTEKLKRAGPLSLELVENPDVLATLATHEWPRRPVFVGFAVETGADDAIIARARDKLTRKGVDLVVANRSDEAFAAETNRVHLVGRSETVSLPVMNKLEVADSILDWLVLTLGERSGVGQRG